MGYPAPMAMYDLSRPLTRIDGRSIRYGQLGGHDGGLVFSPPEGADTDEWAQTPIPLWRLCQHAVLECKKHEDGVEVPLSETEKFDRYQLAVRVNGSQPVELSDEDVATVKRCVGLIWVPEVMGAVWSALQTPVDGG